ncbi:MAG: MATE family efflux transporter [Bacteroidota bacterium]|jgi:MATE family multidrug resistance protein|nr:MATE family efflux transporter [Bacteroidota bacterium]
MRSLRHSNRDGGFRTHLRETTLLAIPVSIGQLGHVMLGVTDSVMVGRLGEVPLAAASLGHGVFVLMLVFAIGICSALTPLTAIADGGGDHSRAATTFRHALFLNFVVGGLLVLFTWLIADVLTVLKQPPAVVALTGPYLRIMGFSFLPMTIFLTFRNFIEGLSFTKPAMVAILLANVVNVFGNWLLIYGNLGMPALGLRGAGYSSVAVELFAAIALTVYVLRAPSFRRYHPMLHFPRLDRAVLSRLLRIGLPSGLQYIFEAGSFTFSAVMIGWLGATALAAHQIALNLASVSFMITLGIAHAATIRVGNAVGREDRAAVRMAGFSAVTMGMTLMGCAAISFIALRDVLPALYIDDTAVRQLAGQLLVLAAIFQLSDGAQVVGHGLLRGMTDVTVPMFIALGAYWVIGVPASYLLAFVAGFGAPGVWMGFVLGLSTAAVSFLLRFHLHSRQSFGPNRDRRAGVA